MIYTNLCLGTLHFQGYIEFKDRQGIRAVARALGGHSYCDQRRGSQADAIAYVTKADTRVHGPWRHGEPSLVVERQAQGLAVILDAVRQGTSLVEAAALDPSSYVRNYRGIEAYRQLSCPKEWRDVRCFYLVGATGVGKSSAVQGPYGAFPYADVYTLAGQEPFWANGYAGQRVLLIDEYQGGIVRELLLRVLDGHPIQLPIKSGFVDARFTCVVFASNYVFREWADPAMRRRFRTGGYFRLSGERGGYERFLGFLRGGAYVEQPGVERVSEIVEPPMPHGACHWAAPNNV